MVIQLLTAVQWLHVLCVRVRVHVRVRVRVCLIVQGLSAGNLAVWFGVLVFILILLFVFIFLGIGTQLHGPMPECVYGGVCSILSRVYLDGAHTCIGRVVLSSKC